MEKNFCFGTILLLFSLLASFEGKCQDDNINYINYRRINFQFKDSLIPFTVFQEKNGYFYFREGFSDKYPSIGNLSFQIKGNTIKAKSGVFTKDSFICRTTDTLLINSRFPLLIKNDSSIHNHDTYPFTPIRLIYELEYSYILANLDEDSIYKSPKKRIIRIVEPTYKYEPRINYSTARVEIEKDKAILVYSRGYFDSFMNFHLERKDTYTLRQKDIIRLENYLNKVDFEKENYFTDIGIDYFQKYLIEYRDNGKYFIIERPEYFKGAVARSDCFNLYSFISGLRGWYERFK